MTDLLDAGAGEKTYRPALVSLALDVREMERDLLEGFASRREVLEWTQRLTIRTLGELDTSVYRDLARQFRKGEHRQQGTLLSALLVGGARRRDLDDDVAEELRERLLVSVIAPAFHRAFHRLRKDATEYIEKAEEAAHDPTKQQYVAMRPALDELETWQQRALSDLLDGLDGTEELIEWAESLELATHGEVDERLVERCYQEQSTRALLLGEQGTDSARELFAAYHLLPRFNAGVRDLSGKAGELPDAEREETEIQYA
jgi:hypothetical protein